MVSASRKRLAVIGGGAKGVAIAAKAKVLKDLGCTYSPTVDIFESDRAGSMWRAGHGYSDGDQFVCTSPHRDLGYPYENFFHDQIFHETDLTDWTPAAIEPLARRGNANGEVYPGVARAMLEQFSIQRFLFGRGKTELNLESWVRSGSRNLSHDELADYLEDAAERTSCPIVEWKHHRVRDVCYDFLAEKWIILYDDGSEYGATAAYDGVVITGNGEPRGIPVKNASREAGRWILDSKRFWVDEAKVRARIERQAKRIDEFDDENETFIAIVGNGGAAAAIAARIASYKSKAPIRIFGGSPVLYGRHPNSFEERLYGSSWEWNRLSDSVKREFLSRLGDGVVWSNVMDELDRAPNVSYRCHRIKSATFHRDDRIFRVEAKSVGVNEDDPSPIRCSLLINAGGFKRVERVTKLCRQYRQKIEHTSKLLKMDKGPAFAELIKPSFEFEGIPSGLHIPDLCGAAGPAGPNLMALGWFSTQILWAYMC